jgi:hypothetical protein
MDKQKLYKVTFTDGEPYCRFDGILATPEHMEKLCGYCVEWSYYDDNFILDDQHLYTDETNIYKILEIFGEYKECTEEYDMISNKGYGQDSHYARKQLDDSFVILNASYLKEITIKSMSKFKEDYPFYNHEEYLKIQNSLDFFYDNLNIL